MKLRLEPMIKAKFSTLKSIKFEELLRHPILDRNNADPDTLQDLDAFPVPVLPRHLSTALRKEFGYPVTVRTDWSHCLRGNDLIESVRGDWWRAARLIHETLAVWRNRPGNPIEASFTTSSKMSRPSRGIEDLEAYADTALAWIQSECTKMYKELQSGCTHRYESLDHLLPENVELSAEHLKLLNPAIVAVGKARNLHPAIKKEIIGHICSVITTAIKK